MSNSRKQITKRMGKHFWCIIIFILSSQLTSAQENIIDHPIKKGESVYVIAKKYGVSMNAIFRLNPGSQDIIYAGRTLKIPVSNTTNTNNTSISEDKITNYKVKRGDTKSGLSRRFGVSIAMLEQQNPHIVRMLQAGHIINIDKNIKEAAPTINNDQHLVVKGETLWGISRRYNVSLAQLTAVNTDQLSEFLQIGQILTIPDKNTIIEDTGKYLVKRGDTKFKLSRRFNMTIAELEQQNPHIIDMLMEGHTIDTTKPDNKNTTSDINTDEPAEDENITEIAEEPTDSTQVSNDIATPNSKYVDYTIKPKETLFSLSQKASMTIDEFTTLNPKLLVAVNAGEVIKMPSEAIENSIITDDDNTIKVTEPNENTNNEIIKNTSLYTNLDTTKTNGIYFYTPFSSEELKSTELRENMINSNDGYQKYLDFFQGAQIAIDSAKVLSLNFEITLIKSLNFKQQLNIESPNEDNVMLIPFLNNSDNYPKVNANQSLSIIDIESNPSEIEDYLHIDAIPSKEIQKKKTLDYISNHDAQVIVVSDLDETQNKNLILESIPNATFLKVDDAGFFKENILQQTLSPNKLNYIILDSEKTIVFLNTTTLLMNQLADYDIQLVLIESSLLPKQNEVSNMRYRVLKLISPTIILPSDNNKEFGFKRIYEDLYGVEPTKSAILGFDITLDILLRLSQKTSFEDTIKAEVSEHSHIKFNYQKTDDKTYSNMGVYLMQYNADEGIIVLKDR